MSARFIIGIDLGTTNTAVGYVDTQAANPKVTRFDIPQLIGPGEFAERRQLPSFVYMAGEHDLTQSETALPWDDRRRFVVGELAQIQGAVVANRVISSAKSWLCHGGVDRHAGILPWGTDDDVVKLSPVACSAMLLRHVKETWEHKMGDENPLEEQEVIVTIPASFDEAARELTVAAADAAGFEDLRLVEEPQAAFYSWIDQHSGKERKEILTPGQWVLVFDVGGGTTDFTLIQVGEDGESLKREAVGDHLLLGGDNIDMAIAKTLESELTGDKKRLSMKQWHQLIHGCRFAKERILSSDSLEEVNVNVAGGGSKLIGKSLSAKVERGTLFKLLDDGFFPEVPASAKPNVKQKGLQEFGLPYASDAAITKHLADFLGRHKVNSISAVLFNGGTMTPSHLRDRVISQIAAWQEGNRPLEICTSEPDLAVAHGAAYYGLVRRGMGARISGGTARSFFVGVNTEENAQTLFCLAAKGMEEGASETLAKEFELICNRPVSFKLFSSSTLETQPGELLELDPSTHHDCLELPPIVTVLRSKGKKNAIVQLEVRVTELGSLEIWCKDTQSDQKWRLSFDMRAGGTKNVSDTDMSRPEFLENAASLIEDVFSGKNKEVKPASLIKALEKCSELRRDEWSMTVTRAFFDATLKAEEHRKRSAEHEARWLNLCGFCLRPGKGAPLDDWRIKQMWRVFNEGLHFEKQEANRLAWWILWRRIAGGLSSGQQEQIYDRLAQLFLPSQNQKKKWFKIKPTKQEAAEMWRILANLEQLPIRNKIKLGNEIIRRIEEPKKKQDDQLLCWALGRIGGRIPITGSLDKVVPPSTVDGWLTSLLETSWDGGEKTALPIAQLGRRTGDRARDIDESVREKLADKLNTLPSGDRMARLVTEVVTLEAREERVLLGDTLPAGLRIRS